MGSELRIENLSKTYANGVRALDGISLSITTGMFGLLGPNGAGKSTLMRTIATLQEPDDGSIHLGALDVLAQKEEVRKVLGYLPQEFGVYPNITARAMLRHLAVLKGIERKQVEDVVEGLLTQTNLQGAARRKLGTFSGGMKQRFGIAQALLGQPKLIIVDEPTAGLDPAERLRFLNLLSQIGEEIVVILSTHIVADVTELCPRMAVISNGRLLLEGRPGDAIEALRARVWSRIVERAELAAVERDHEVISTHLLAGRTIVNVFAEAHPGDGFEPVEAGLEDVYFHTLRQDGGRRAA
jgi:ABC-type multidrug transport system ATPase subunit